MPRRILILDASIYPQIYHPFGDWVTLLDGVRADHVHLPFDDRPISLAPYTHVIITGSEASINEPAPWFAPLEAAVHEAVARGLPVLGSCFGHQMLMRALSGAKHVGRAASPELGWIEIEVIADDPLLADVPRRWRVFASHFDEVVSPPPPWRVLAKSADCAVQAMRYGDRPIWGLQPHPEIPPERARALLEAFVPYFQDKAPLLRQALATTCADDGMGHHIVRRFLAESP